MPKYTIHDVRLHPEQTEETTAFTADLHLDGSKIASVGNDGKGGCHRYDFDNGRLYGAFLKWADAQPCDYEFEKGDQAIDAMLLQAMERPLRTNPLRVKRVKQLFDIFSVKGTTLVVIGDLLHWAADEGMIKTRSDLDAFLAKAVKASDLID